MGDEEEFVDLLADIAQGSDVEQSKSEQSSKSLYVSFSPGSIRLMTYPSTE